MGPHLLNRLVDTVVGGAKADYNALDKVGGAIRQGATNIATLGESSHPGSVRSYLGSQKSGFDLNTPQGMLLAALMLSGRSPMGSRTPAMDPYDKAAQNLAFQRDRNALIMEMRRAGGSMPQNQIPGVGGKMTPQQKAFLDQLQYNPLRNMQDPGFRFITPKKVRDDPSTYAMYDALGYTAGDPFTELVAKQGSHAPTDEVLSKLGWFDQEGSRALPGKMGSPPEALFPLWKQGPRNWWELIGPNNTPVNQGGAFMKLLNEIMSGKYSDTGPPPR